MAEELNRNEENAEAKEEIIKIDGKARQLTDDDIRQRMARAMQAGSISSVPSAAMPTEAISNTQVRTAIWRWISSAARNAASTGGLIIRADFTTLVECLRHREAVIHIHIHIPTLIHIDGEFRYRRTAGYVR